MLQELFRIPLGDREIPIYGFGLMMVIGFLAAAHLAKCMARRRGLDGETFVNAALLGLFTGIIGCRISHILENLHEFVRPDRTAWANFLSMFDFSSGGLTYYGGFLLAFPTLVLYAIWKKIPLRTGMDIVAPCLLVGMAVGRIGCFLNGCCYGAECHQPWAVRFPYFSSAYADQLHDGLLTPPPPRELIKFIDGKPYSLSRREIREQHLTILASQQRSVPVHPAQLYSAFTLFLLAGLVFAYYTLPHAPGRAFALMLFLEGPSRFVLELVRSEPPVWGQMSLSMVLGLAMMTLGVVLWLVFGWAAKYAESLSAP